VCVDSQVIRFISSCSEKCTPNTEMELKMTMETRELNHRTLVATATIAKVSQSEICGSVLWRKGIGKSS